MSRWFRFYDDAINDPKVQRLSAEMFRAWVNMLCLASKYEGAIPKADVSFALRATEKGAAAIIDSLIEHNLLEDRGDVVTPHNWDGRQYKSDTSAERVKRHRNNKRNAPVTPNETETKQPCNVTSTVTVTPPDTETETEQKGIDKRTRELHAKFLKVARSDVDTPKLWGSEHGLNALLFRGFSEETILSGAARAMQSCSDPPPPWSYFVKCIETENRERSAPAQKETKGDQSGSVHAAASNLVERMRELDQPVGYLRGGEGSTVVRMLPKG